MWKNIYSNKQVKYCIMKIGNLENTIVVLAMAEITIKLTI